MEAAEPRERHRERIEEDPLQHARVDLHLLDRPAREERADLEDGALELARPHAFPKRTGHGELCEPRGVEVAAPECGGVECALEG